MCVPSLAGESVLRMNYPDFWPFYTRTQNGQLTGLFYEIMSNALDRMEIESVWESYPWGRCQSHVQSGDADGMITVPTPERLQYCKTHKTPFYLKTLTIFTYKDHPKLKEIQSIKTPDDILKLNLTVITYSGNGWNNRNIKSLGIRTYASPRIETVWPMLSNHRGDIVIEWPIAAWPDIRKAQITNDIVMTNATLESMPFHLMIRKGSPYANRLDEFDKTIERMKQDGTINKIMQKYTKDFQTQIH
jgi:polar amino acid transport system substrate-binding protein